MNIIRALGAVGAVMLASFNGAAAGAAEEASSLIERGTAAHAALRLREAADLYSRALAADPPAEPTAAELDLVLQLAPRLFTVPGEFFPLKDIVAIVHPDRPLIGYHLFWEDDIDFPDDQHPADHEVVWVEYDPATRRPIAVHTYLHRRIIRNREPESRAAQLRIGVEWGKHGSVSLNALAESAEAREVLHDNWAKLSTMGRRKPDHPLGRTWPARFDGDFNAYRNFSVPVSAARLLEERKLIFVSRWPNAVLHQYCLRYNFAPKTAWPQPNGTAR